MIRLCSIAVTLLIFLIQISSDESPVVQVSSAMVSEGSMVCVTQSHTRIYMLTPE